MMWCFKLDINLISLNDSTETSTELESENDCGLRNNVQISDSFLQNKYYVIQYVFISMRYNFSSCLYILGLAHTLTRCDGYSQIQILR
jgi:hypothetical protein